MSWPLGSGPSVKLTFGSYDEIFSSFLAVSTGGLLVKQTKSNLGLSGYVYTK